MISEFDFPDGDIDWDVVRSRLAEMQNAVVQSDQLSPADADALLEERARALARVPEASPEAGRMLELMTIRLGDGRFAIETRYVQEVYRADNIMPVPESPDFLLGLTNLRGEVLAVLDLCRLFNLPTIVEGESNRLVVLGEERAQFAVLVVEAEEVLMLHIDEVLETPDSVASVGGEYLRGMTADALSVIDGRLLLADERLYMDQSD